MCVTQEEEEEKGDFHAYESVPSPPLYAMVGVGRYRLAQKKKKKKKKKTSRLRRIFQDRPFPG